MQRDGSGGPWRAVRPPLDLRQADDAAAARYLEATPAEVLAIVRRFPDRHWHLLRLAASLGDAATDFLESNPALGCMVAADDEFRGVHHTDAATVARMLLAPRRRQRDVLSWLRVPPGNAVRRIVRRIEHDAISPSRSARCPRRAPVGRLLGLRERMGEDDCQHHLAHLPRIRSRCWRSRANGCSTASRPRCCAPWPTGAWPMPAPYRSSWPTRYACG